jgi:hypothetical protein
MGGIIFPPKEFARELRRVEEEYPVPFENVTAPNERDRIARNICMSLKIYERADYGLLADLRELLALRLAPWLRPQP